MKNAAFGTVVTKVLGVRKPNEASRSCWYNLESFETDALTRLTTTDGMTSNNCISESTYSALISSLMVTYPIVSLSATVVHIPRIDPGDVAEIYLAGRWKIRSQ